MRSIGFRAEKSQVRFVVLEGNNDPRKIAAEGILEVGEKRALPAELVLLRTQLQSLLQTHKPDVGGIRLSDKPQRTSHIQSMFARARLEGVILLVAGECGLKIKFGAAGTMKAGMKTKKPLRDYVAEDEVRGIDLTGRGRKAPEFRDAVIAALAALGA